MENIPDTPEGIILESLLEGMNQYFSAELSQKVSRGIRESWNKGYCTGQRLFGYDVVDKKYVINEYEAAIVKEIFVKYSQGFKVRFIAEDLRSRKVVRKKGKIIDDKFLYYLLHNSRYTGKVEHDGKIYDNIYPPIISEELWNKVSIISEGNKIAPSRKKDVFNFILSGKIFCGNCKERVYGISGKGRNGVIHYYYVCSAKHKKKNDCTLKTVPKQMLEDLVIETTTVLLKQNGNIKKIAEELYALHQKETNDNTALKSLKKQRNAAVKASNNLIRAIEQGIITEQTKTRLKELETQIAGLDFEIEKETQKPYSNLTPEIIADYLNSKIFDNSHDLKTRKLLVNTFIREIVIYDNKIIITYNFSDTEQTPEYSPEKIIELEKQSEISSQTVFFCNNGLNFFRLSSPIFKKTAKKRLFFYVFDHFAP